MGRRGTLVPVSAFLTSTRRCHLPSLGNAPFARISVAWVRDALSSAPFPGRPASGLRGLLVLFLRENVNGPTSSATGSPTTPSPASLTIAQIAQLIKAAMEAYHVEGSPESAVAKPSDELAIIGAVDGDPLASFLADELWLLDAELGDWEKAVLQPKDRERDRSKLLQHASPQRQRLVELVTEIVVSVTRVSLL